MKLQQDVKVKNLLGLHARPATVISRLLQKNMCRVSFTFQGETINARSIMSLLMLAAPKNAIIHLEVERDDAEPTMADLVNQFETEFGELGTRLTI